MARQKTQEEIPFFYVTPNEYAKKTNMWVEDVKRLIKEGKLEGTYNENSGYYKVKVYKNEAVSRAEHESVLKELEKYKTIVKTFLLSATEIVGRN